MCVDSVCILAVNMTEHTIGSVRWDPWRLSILPLNIKGADFKYNDEQCEAHMAVETLAILIHQSNYHAHRSAVSRSVQICSTLAM